MDVMVKPGNPETDKSIQFITETAWVISFDFWVTFVRLIIYPGISSALRNRQYIRYYFTDTN